MRDNQAVRDSWDFRVGSRPVRDVRRWAREDALGEARAFSASMGLDVPTSIDAMAPLVVTGHQPEFFHPGVWVKTFLADRLAERYAGTALNLVVDSDAFESLAVSVPATDPAVRRDSVTLATGGEDVCYHCADVPAPEDVRGFLAEVDRLLAGLKTTGERSDPRGRFDVFGECLLEAATCARNLAELVVVARRRFEASAGTRYLELPVTALMRGRAFPLFVLGIASEAERFVEAYNAELDAFRAQNQTRSAAQPFPNLRREGERTELPFWVLAEGGRSPLWAASSTDGAATLYAGEREIGTYRCCKERDSARLTEDALIAPKAVALTLFARMFLADLFVHGTGGARYDRVTDGVIRRYYGVDSPGFLVASLTLALPVDFERVSEERVSAALERLNRFEHNPDAFVTEAAWDRPSEKAEAVALVERKAALVASIALPDANRKVLGAEIRAINEALRARLAPIGESLRRDRERIEASFAASEILYDRTYPFCFFSPEEVAATLR